LASHVNQKSNMAAYMQYLYKSFIYSHDMTNGVPRKTILSQAYYCWTFKHTQLNHQHMGMYLSVIFPNPKISFPRAWKTNERPKRYHYGRKGWRILVAFEHLRERVGQGMKNYQVYIEWINGLVDMNVNVPNSLAWRNLLCQTNFDIKVEEYPKLVKNYYIVQDNNNNLSILTWHIIEFN